MPIKTIESGKSLAVKTPGLYLSIISTTGQFIIESELFGELVGKVGRQFKLPNVQEVSFRNPGPDAIDVEWEVANIEVFGNGSGAVSIENKPTIKRIEEPIQVTAEATVEDGTVTSQSPTTLGEVDDITVAAGAKVQVLAATAKDRRLVTLQNLSADMTLLRVGGATVAAGRGAILRGSLDAIASAELESVAAIYVFNESASPATVSVMWGDK